MNCVVWSGSDIGVSDVSVEIRAECTVEVTVVY